MELGESHAWGSETNYLIAAPLLQDLRTSLKVCGLGLGLPSGSRSWRLPFSHPFVGGVTACTVQLWLCSLGYGAGHQSVARRHTDKACNTHHIQ